MITFRGTYLPIEVSIHYQKCKVSPFIKRVIICHKCLLYHHVAKQCRSMHQKCAFCLSTTHLNSNECPNKENPKCLHCQPPNNDHSVLDMLKCPKFKEEKNIKERMAYKNISYNEAKKELSNKTYSEVLLNDNKYSFPPLTKEQLDTINDNPVNSFTSNANTNKVDISRVGNYRRTPIKRGFRQLNQNKELKKNKKDIVISNKDNREENNSPKENNIIEHEKTNESEIIQNVEDYFNNIKRKILELSQQEPSNIIESLKDIEKLLETKYIIHTHGFKESQDNTMEL